MIRRLLLAAFNGYAALWCRHCRAGKPVRRRASTKEFVHDLVTEQYDQFLNRVIRRTVSHTLCESNHIRNSKLAKALTNG